jgi:pimeloyl-ACP methyl ester carboxylesterase
MVGLSNGRKTTAVLAASGNALKMKGSTISGGDGVQLYVEETGNPGGTPILFVHGFSQSRLCWRKQLQSELAENFRLVALDNRGHGLSEKRRDVYGDTRLWAEDIQAVITTLELDRPVLVGWSYGGEIICDYLRHHGQERIRGIHFVGAVSRLGNSALRFMGKEFLTLAAGFGSSEVEQCVDALEQFARLCLHKEILPEDFYFFLGCSMAVPPYVRARLFGRQIENDDLLMKITKPVFIAHGEADRIVLPEMANYHAAKIKHAQLSLYPNIGHMPFWEDPERFNAQLRSFVSGLA